MNQRYDLFDPALFALNRQRLAAQMKPNSVAIFSANEMMPRSGDLVYPFRQNADMFYLTGIDQEDCMFVFFPDCVKEKFREVLILKKTSELIAIWEGYKYTKEDATKVSGIEKVIWDEDSANTLNELILLADNIYINTNENDRFDSHVPYLDLRFAHQMRFRYPNHHYERLAPVMKRLRCQKSAAEVAAIQQACNITEAAFRRVLGFVKAGVWEYEIEAEVTHEFMRSRANGHAYTPIIASGGNACVLHYIANNQQCKAGDVMLMDFGAEYANYSADMTRCIPVSGRFTARQKAVYNAVLRVMKEATAMLVVGNDIESYHKEVGKVMEAELIGLGLLNANEVAKQDPDAPLYKKYFMHGTSHHLGLDTHDLAHRYRPFLEGMVYTCEPGIYIPEENIGIRLENDILLTANGPRDLMQNIPLEAEHIEELMNA